MSENRHILDRAIAKWDKIIDGSGYDLGSDDCSFCENWMWGSSLRCTGCPLYEAGMGCEKNDSPYMKWADMEPEDLIHYHYNLDELEANCVDTTAMREAAVNMRKAIIESWEKMYGSF